MTYTDRFFRIFKIIFALNSMYEMLVEANNRLKRRWWVRPVNITRNELGFYATCFQKLKLQDEEHFFKATRMSIAKFHTLLNLVKEILQRTSRREPINAECRLALTLMYLSQGCSPQYLAWSHKMGVSTVRNIIYDTCSALWTELHDVYVAQPNQYEWKRISDSFYIKTGMPNCVGAIDGKHIKIVAPANSGSLYFNYKRTYSIVLMAACDSNYTFTFVDVGAMGSESDGGVFSRSTFGKMILNGRLNVPPDAAIPGTDTQYQFYFVGDSAFPLKHNLMRPFPGRNLPPTKENYNKKLSGARVFIENTFGILSCRWRILHTTIHAAPKNVDKIVLATIVLHNFLMLDRDSGYFSEELVDRSENGIEVPGTWRESNTSLTSCRTSQTNRSSADAFRSRETLTNILFNNLR